MEKLPIEEVRKQIQAVFSLLPHEIASPISGGAMSEYEHGVEYFRAEMPSIEWGLDGKPGDITVTNFADFSARSLERSQLDDELEAIVAALEAGPPSPGQIDLSPSGQELSWTVSRVRPLAGNVTLIIPFALFAIIIDLSNSPAHLSDKEKHVMFELLGGRSLRQSAEAAGVSFETRRFQLKSVCAKLGCSGQTDIVRRMLGQLARLPQIFEYSERFETVGDRFIRTNCPGDVRIHRRDGAQGDVLRWIECGAPDGAPLLLVHGIMLPLLLTGLHAAVDLSRYRLIMPIRKGYLEPIDAKSLYATGALAGKNVDDLAELAAVIGNEPVTVIGHSFGCLTALDFASRHPELVRELKLLSINLGKPEETNIGFLGRMFAGLHKLSNTPGLLRVIAGYYRRAYADEKTVLRVLTGMFTGSPTDLAYIEQGSDGRFISWFSDLYQNSILGISEDFHHAVNFREDAVSTQCPVSFHHGIEDGLSSDHAVRALASTIGHATVQMHPGGHLLCTTVAPEVLAEALGLKAASEQPQPA